VSKRNALGRGLGALIPGANEPDRPTQDSSQGERVVDIPVARLQANPHQPRTEFDEEAVNELAASLKEKGVIQPLLVRRWGDGYQLVAGERRLRAAKRAGLESVPAIVRDITTDEEMMELSIIENVQREDLNPVEEARAYRSLMENCTLTQEEVAQKVGKDRSTISNTLRLLALEPVILEALASGAISSGHARALLGIDDLKIQAAICRDIIRKGLSVRRTEGLVKAYRKGSAAKPVAGGGSSTRDPQVRALEEDLQRRLGTAVHITHREGKGKIEIEYYSNDDLDRLLELIGDGM